MGKVVAFVTVAAMVAVACGNAGDKKAERSTATTAAGGPTAAGGERTTKVPVDEKGVTDSEIRFTSIATKTNNPLGTNIADAYNDGIEAYFAWRNAEGGIYGRKLVLAKKRDDQLVRNAEEAQAMVSEDDSFGAFVATLFFSGADVLNQNNVPTFGWNIHPEFGGRRAIFGQIGPLCFGCVGRAIPWAMQQLGRTRIGILAYGVTENSKICGVGIRESIKRYGPDVGGATVAYFDNSLPFGLPNGLAPQVSAMKKAGVDFIATCMDLNGMKTLGEELARQGMDDVVMWHPNSYNHAFVKANARIFEGDIVSIGSGFTAFEAKVDSEGQRRFLEWTDKLGKKREELTMVGWMNADLAFQGLLAAGPKFSRTGVIDAIRTRITHWTAGGLTPPVDWTKQLELPTPGKRGWEGPLECFNAVKVVNGAFVQAFGEPGKPWVCWDNTTDEWHQPKFMSFA
ncbi:MAG: branched-chain amino acid ABC transporter substrate-binding protein [Acidimicrobiia bacterium]